MEDFGSVWTFQENVDELKEKLQYMTNELEITRKITNEEILKNNENIKKLLQLLQIACKERDEAKSKLHELQQILEFNNNKSLNVDQLNVSPFSPDTTLLSNFPSLTKSNSLSRDIDGCGVAYSVQCRYLQSFNAPSTVSTPDSNNICFREPTSVTTKAVDEATLSIEGLVKGRPRPEPGTLLQAVVQAGPLLQTLMVAGSLPCWRNPPGLMTHQVPSTRQLVKGLDNSPHYGPTSGGSMSVCPKSMLDFGSGSLGGSCLVGLRMMPSSMGFDCPTLKRHTIL